MGSDKALLKYHDQPEWRRVFNLLESHTEKTFVSLNPEQGDTNEFSDVPRIVDRWDSIGPINGIASAMQEHPHAAWLVAACDMPNLNDAAISQLVTARKPDQVATVFVDAEDRLEVLCAVYEPSIAEHLFEIIANKRYSLYRCLERLAVKRISIDNAPTLTNLNTPEESDNYRRHGVKYSSRKENK